MTLLKQHLNWTLGLGVLLIETPFILLLLFGDYSSIGLPTLLTLVITTIICEWTLIIWYLYQKKRSYFYLLYCFLKITYIPLGLILLLRLSNNRIPKAPEPPKPPNPTVNSPIALYDNTESVEIQEQKNETTKPAE